MLELSFYHYTVNNFCKIIPKHKSSRVYWKSNDLKLISLHVTTAQCYKMEKGINATGDALHADFTTINSLMVEPNLLLCLNRPLV